MSAIGNAINPLNKAWTFFFSRPLQIISDFAKVALLALLLQLIFGGMGQALATVMEVDFEGSEPPVDFIVASMIIAIPAIILNSALNATPYSLVDERTKGRQGKVIEKTIELVPPVGVFMLTVLLIFIGLMVAGVILSSLTALVDPLIGMIPMIAAALGVILLVLALQFAIPEIVLHGVGTKEAIKRSWGIVTKNLGTVIVFDVLLAVFVLLFSILVGGLGMSSAPVSTMGEVIGFVYTALLNVISGVVMTVVMVLPIYFLWKSLTAPEKAPVEKPKGKPAARRKVRRKKR